MTKSSNSAPFATKKSDLPPGERRIEAETLPGLPRHLSHTLGLLAYRDGKKGAGCFASASSMARDLKLTTRSVQRHLAALAKLDAYKKVKAGRFVRRYYTPEAYMQKIGQHPEEGKMNDTTKPPIYNTKTTDDIRHQPDATPTIYDTGVPPPTTRVSPKQEGNTTFRKVSLNDPPESVARGASSPGSHGVPPPPEKKHEATEFGAIWTTKHWRPGRPPKNGSFPWPRDDWGEELKQLCRDAWKLAPKMRSCLKAGLIRLHPDKLDAFARLVPGTGAPSTVPAGGRTKPRLSLVPPAPDVTLKADVPAVALGATLQAAGAGSVTLGRRTT